MDTAVIASGPASVRPIRHTPLVERISRRAGLALVAWSHRAEHRRGREYLAELHERRQEAERLRGEVVRSVTLARLL
jgi:hypothetical protein